MTTKSTTAKTKKQPIAEVRKENERLKALLAEQAEGTGTSRHIRPDEYIEVMSLCPNPLNLSTSRHSPNKKVFRFPKLGDTKHIMYEYLVEIIENHPTFAESGLFYITNPDVVRRHGLLGHYDSILTKDEISDVLTLDTNAAMKIFDSANDKQQRHIADLVEALLVKDESDVDMNLVHKISNATGIDIIARAENTKDYNKLIENDK